MSGHDLIDDYLSELMDDPGKGDRSSAPKPGKAAGQPTTPPRSDPDAQSHGQDAQPSPAPADDPLAGFRDGSPTISDDEFEAMLDALHGGSAQDPEPAEAAPPAGAVDPLAAFRDGSENIGDDEFEAMLDALQGRAPDAAAAAGQAALAAGGDPLAAFRDGSEDIGDDEFEAMLDALQSAPPPVAAAPAAGLVGSTRLPSATIRALLPPSEPVPAHGEHATSPERRRRADDRITSWLRFNLARQCFAVEVLKVQEVLRVPLILPVRGTSEATLGVMNLRGQIVPVMDLAIRLGFSPTQANEASRVIVLEEKGETLGLLVASVADVLNLSDARMERISGTPSLVAAEVVRGISRREGQIVIMLDASQLLA